MVTMRLKWTMLAIIALTACITSLFFGAAELSPKSIVSCLAMNCESPSDELIFLADTGAKDCCWFFGWCRSRCGRRNAAESYPQ